MLDMELAAQILTQILENEKINVSVSISKKDIAKIFNDVCYDTLRKIREIVCNDSLSDSECIEEIISLFYLLGSDAGNRHGTDNLHIVLGNVVD